MRLFAKLSLDQAIPDRTTIMNFRHLLELQQLARQLFGTINQWLCDAGIMMKQGTLVDATIIEAPNSTKNKRGERDLNRVGNMLHGKEEFVFADAGYQGAENRDELADVKAEWAVTQLDLQAHAVQFTLFIAPYCASMAVVFLARGGGLSGTNGATHFSSLLLTPPPASPSIFPPAGPFLCVGSHPAAVLHLTNL